MSQRIPDEAVKRAQASYDNRMGNPMRRALEASGAVFFTDPERRAILRYLPAHPCPNAVFESARAKLENGHVRRVAITGDRDWARADVILRALRTLNPATDYVVLGDARGADTLARGACEDLGLSHEVHRADWRNHHRAAGPILELLQYPLALPR